MPVYLVEEYGFEFEPRILEDFIKKEKRHNLWKLGDIFRSPRRDFSKIEGKRLIGSAVRIWKAIGKPEHAKKFHDIVGECLTPDKHQIAGKRLSHYGLKGQSMPPIALV
jgi:hypothetical protein